MFEKYIVQIIVSAIVIILLPISKVIANKIVMKYGQMTHKAESRIVQIKHVIAILINFVCLFTLAVIWGVQPQNMLIALSSIFAVIGVAMFAQWSILSNITAGIIVFFATPFRIGDKIQLLDKDMPIEATIENIQTFYTHLRTDDNELIILPNNLFLQKMISLKKEQ